MNKAVITLVRPKKCILHASPTGNKVAAFIYKLRASSSVCIRLEVATCKLFHNSVRSPKERGVDNTIGPSRRDGAIDGMDYSERRGDNGV